MSSSVRAISQVIIVTMAAAVITSVTGVQLTHVTLISGRKCYYEYPEDSGTCYVVGFPEVTWPSALLTCTMEGGMLLSKPTITVNKVINEILERVKTSEAWIGMTRLHVPWTWTSGPRYNDSNSDLWVSGQPSPYDSEHDCVYLDVTQGYKMAAGSCHARAGYVCQAQDTAAVCLHSAVYFTEIVHHNGTCFMFMDKSRSQAADVTWFGVEHACATIGSEFERKFMTNHVDVIPARLDSLAQLIQIKTASPGKDLGIQKYWIGLTRARWLVASGLYIDSVGQSTGNCVTLARTPDVAHVFIAHDCYKMSAYVCEFDLLTAARENTSMAPNISITYKTTAGASKTTQKTQPGETTNTVSTTVRRAVTSTPDNLTSATSQTTQRTASISQTMRQTSDPITVSTQTRKIEGTTVAVVDDVIPIADDVTVVSHRSNTEMTTADDVVMTSQYDDKILTSEPLKRNTRSSPETTTTPSWTVSKIPCSEPITLTFVVSLTIHLANISETQRINILINNITHSISNKAARRCFNVTVASLDGSPVMTEQTDDKTPQVFVFFSECDSTSLKKFGSIDPDLNVFRVLVCFGIEAPKIRKPEIEEILAEFHTVVAADDEAGLESVSDHVANRLLRKYQEPPPDGVTTVKTSVVSWIDKRVLALAIGLPCAVVAMVIMIVAVLLTRKQRRSSAKSDSARRSHFRDVYDRILHDSTSTISTSPDNVTTSFPDPESPINQPRNSVISGETDYFTETTSTVESTDTSVQISPFMPDRHILQSSIDFPDQYIEAPKSFVKTSSRSSTKSNHNGLGSKMCKLRASIKAGIFTKSDARSSSRSDHFCRSKFGAGKQSSAFVKSTRNASTRSEMCSRRSDTRASCRSTRSEGKMSKADDRFGARGKYLRRSKRGAVKIGPQNVGNFADNAPNMMFYNCWTVPPLETRK